MKQKMITITEEQEQWIQDKYIKLSPFVRKKIHEVMDEERINK